MIEDFTVSELQELFNEPDRKYKYKTLCEMLDEPVCANNKREKQLTRWGKYLDINRSEKAWIKIDWVFDETERFIAQRYYRTSALLGLGICELLEHSNKRIEELTVNKWMENTGVLPQIYFQGQQNWKLVADQLESTKGMNPMLLEGAIKQCYTEFYSILYNTVEAALTAMEQANVLTYRRGFYLYSNPSSSNWKPGRTATEKEVSQIFTIQTQAAQECGFNQINDIFYASKEKRAHFNYIFSVKLFELTGYFNASKTFRVIVSPESVRFNKSRVMDLIQYEVNKNITQKMLNKKIRMLNQTEFQKEFVENVCKLI